MVCSSIGFIMCDTCIFRIYLSAIIIPGCLTCLDLYLHPCCCSSICCSTCIAGFVFLRLYFWCMSRLWYRIGIKNRHLERYKSALARNWSYWSYSTNPNATIAKNYEASSSSYYVGHASIIYTARTVQFALSPWSAFVVLFLHKSSHYVYFSMCTPIFIPPRFEFRVVRVRN